MIDGPEQLLQYKKYKEAAEVLKEKEDKYINIFYKNAEIIDDMDEDKLFMDLSLGDLVNAFNEVLKRYKENTVLDNLEHRIIREEITVDDKMEIIRRLLDGSKRVYFESLFTGVVDKLDIIITFLALLELIKLREINVFQSKPYEQILIQSIDSGV
jgi:segregation and condensation protein A